MPDASELDSEEGIGFFREVWTIVDVPRSDAQLVVQREREILSVIDGLAATAEDFDRLARCVEWWDPDESDEEVSSAERSALASAVGDADSAELGGLELGVAGLVHGLAGVGMVPAASCRGHTGARPWSESPVVLFAADEFHARALEPLVRAAGCVFDLDPGRTELLVVGASSVVSLMRLAAAVVEADDLYAAQVDPDPGLIRAEASGQLKMFDSE